MDRTYSLTISSHAHLLACLYVLILLLGTPCVGHTSPTRPEALIPELQNILDSASAEASALVEQNYLRKEADERLMQAKADYYPQLDLRSSLGYRQDFRSGGAEDTSNFGLNYSARLTRPLYHWGSIEARIEQARIDNDSQALNFLLNTQRIFRDLRAEYLTLRLNQVQLEAEQLHRKILASEIDQLKGDYEAGNISSRAYRTKQLDLQNSLLMIDKIDRDQKRILDNFSKNAGWNKTLVDKNEIPSPDLGQLLKWMDEQVDRKSDVWVDRHADIQLAQRAIDKQQEEIVKIKARQRPLINFTTSASQNQSNTSTQNNVDTLSLFAGISVNWNVFDGFETKHEMIEANIKQRRLEEHRNRRSSDLEDEQTRLLDQLRFYIDRNKIMESRFEIEQLNLADRQADTYAGVISKDQLMKVELALKRLKVELTAARAELLMMLSDYCDLIEPANI